eukprot:Nk52_evm1s699 gene=Nk52_evmTU1s699
MHEELSQPAESNTLTTSAPVLKKVPVKAAFQDHVVYGDVFENIDLLDRHSKGEQIWIADIPYELSLFGHKRFNSSSDPNFLPKFVDLVKSRLEGAQSAQSLIFASWEQAIEIQRRIGGRLLWAVDVTGMDTISRAKATGDNRRIMKNQVQAAVYTLWGEL